VELPSMKKTSLSEGKFDNRLPIRLWIYSFSL